MIRAHWKKLIMANYVINPQVLGKYLPYKTEIDRLHGQCYLSLVGFMFLDTRVLGIKFPYHINFEEINLRFYVIHPHPEGVKRGVVFIKEIVPLPLISLMANSFYKEHYETRLMKHYIKSSPGQLTVEYNLKKKDWHTLKIISVATPLEMTEGSEELFFTDQHWGYTQVSPQSTLEYGVAHPRWKYYKTLDYTIDVDFGNIYGDEFSFLTTQEPHSVFLAEGSEISLTKSARFAPGP